MQRRHAIEVAVQAGLSVLTVPSLEDMLAGKVAISQIRQVQLEDLLGREPVQLDDRGLLAWLSEKVVLVTGAGGSIGSELVRQIAQFKPRRLVLIDLSEFALYQIEQEFEMQFPRVPMACFVGDVKDADFLDLVFSNYRPSVVFHAAAYKHVPLLEGENAWQAVRNNVLGSKCLAEVSKSYGVEKVVLISTDKAVNPSNVMGATKRLAERACSNRRVRALSPFVSVMSSAATGPSFRNSVSKSPVADR